MELPLFRSLRRKYRRLFHCCLKNYVTTASLNTSSYICLMCNLFPRIYIDLVYFSLTTFSHVLLFIFSLFCSLFYFYFLFNASQYCYFSTFSLFVWLFFTTYAYCLLSNVAVTSPEVLATLVTAHILIL